MSRWEYCIVISLFFFVQLDIWFLYLIGIVFCVFCVVLFFYVMVQFSVLLYSFSVLLYSSVSLCCSLLFILLCSSCYACVFDSIYCTSTLPPGVNPIAVNKYLSILSVPISQVITAVLMKTQAFWNIIPCRLVSS